MAIDDIKDINKLRVMLKEAQCEVKYLKECSKQAGLELAKNSYAYDYKEKNLVVQAMAVNDKLQAKEQEYEELKHDLRNIQHNCTRDGCKYYDDNTYKVFYNCKGKTELSKCRQALDEIEKILDNGTANTQTNNAKWLQQHYLARFCEIRNIINKAKDGE